MEIFGENGPTCWENCVENYFKWLRICFPADFYVKTFNFQMVGKRLSKQLGDLHKLRDAKFRLSVKFKAFNRPFPLPLNIYLFDNRTCHQKLFPLKYCDTEATISYVVTQVIFSIQNNPFSCCCGLS